MPLRTRTMNIHVDPESYTYRPLADITAHEIALMLPILFAAWQDANAHAILGGRAIPEWLNAQIENLPPNARRHFEGPTNKS